MGLAGGIVRRVFSKSPCSSAGGGGGCHNENRGGGSADHNHKRRWSSLRMYLCGDESTAAAAEEEDDNDDDEYKETVSIRSSEASPMPQVPAARPCNAAVAEEQGSIIRAEDEAATRIQSAFRGFMARMQLLELRARAAAAGEPRSPAASASVAASVEVQVGESLSNLRLSDDSESAAQHRASSQRSSRPPPPSSRTKEEWDDSTVSTNVARMRMQSRIEATTRRERALAYAFSQQLRTCSAAGGGGGSAGGGGGGGGKKRQARPEQAEFNVGWSWLERWMATRQAEPADDCMSKNADTGSASASASARRVIVVRRRSDVAVEEKESCGSNDVSSAVSFDGSSAGGLGCYKPSKNRLRGGGRNLPRRKVAASSDHRPHARSHKVSKKVHERSDEDHEQQQQQHRDQIEAHGYDASQPPTDY